MMMQITENLFVGNGDDCLEWSEKNICVIHACKYPCHTGALGYSGALPKGHPHYLIYEEGLNLYLNMVDMNQALTHIFAAPMLTKAMNFIDKHIDDWKILVHCNHGVSRAPTIALLWLAKRAKKISDVSYAQARKGFEVFYPDYAPCRGMEIYLETHWDQLK